MPPASSRKPGTLDVSVRTLHFYDELGLLKPAYISASGYRYYEEPQFLTLQQILFYRELGFELRKIKSILGQAHFEKAAALESHRSVLEKDLGYGRRPVYFRVLWIEFQAASEAPRSG